MAEAFFQSAALPSPPSSRSSTWSSTGFSSMVLESLDASSTGASSTGAFSIGVSGSAPYNCCVLSAAPRRCCSSVRLKRERHVRVSQAFGDKLLMHTRLERHARPGAAQIANANSGHARVATQGMKRSSRYLRVPSPGLRLRACLPVCFTGCLLVCGFRGMVFSSRMNLLRTYANLIEGSCNSRRIYPSNKLCFNA